MTADPRKPFLQVKDLHVHFPTDDGLVKAVDGMDFTLERGKTVGIVGYGHIGSQIGVLAEAFIHECLRTLVHSNPPRGRGIEREPACAAASGVSHLLAEPVGHIHRDVAARAVARVHESRVAKLRERGLVPLVALGRTLRRRY